jgi:bacterial/archaeal transporter family-2 protein
MTAFSQISTFWLTVIIICIGLTVPVQAGVNAQLGRFLANPIFAGLVSFVVGTGTMLLLMVVGQAPWPAMEKFSGVPWWAWIGGFFGAIFVLGTLIVAPRLGAATTLGLIVAGQMISSLVFDHFGLIGFPHHTISPMRIVGVILLIIGVFLIRKF